MIEKQKIEKQMRVYQPWIRQSSVQNCVFMDRTASFAQFRLQFEFNKSRDLLA